MCHAFLLRGLWLTRWMDTETVSNNNNNKTLRVEQMMLGFKQMFGQRGGAGLGVELEDDVTVSLICVIPFASH